MQFCSGTLSFYDIVVLSAREHRACWRDKNQNRSSEFLVVLHARMIGGWTYWSLPEVCVEGRWLPLAGCPQLS